MSLSTAFATWGLVGLLVAIVFGRIAARQEAHDDAIEKWRRMPGA